MIDGTISHSPRQRPALLEKPPLYFWLMVGSFKLFGQNEWAGRLPSVAAAWP
jgi:uncharacterized membrane protein